MLDILKTGFRQPPAVNGRHIVSDQIRQGEEFKVLNFNRAFWSNRDNTFTCHIWNAEERVSVASNPSETLQSFVDRTELAIKGVLNV